MDIIARCARQARTGAAPCSYEDAVRRLRADPAQALLVARCYLDEDVGAAARRFAASEEFAQTARLLGLRRGRDERIVLDVGCGNGIAAYAFAGLGHRVIAVNPDPSDDVGLGAARRLAGLQRPGALECVQAVSEGLPFDDGFADVVYARQTLHHFADLGRGLAECARVLKPGGSFLAAREHVISRPEDLAPFLESHPLHRFHGAENAHLLADYLAAIASAGLSLRRRLGPLDSTITSFPASRAEVRRMLLDSLGGRHPAHPLRLLMFVPGGEALVRHLFSRNDQHPGRLYAFLCRKPRWRRRRPRSAAA